MVELEDGLVVEEDVSAPGALLELGELSAQLRVRAVEAPHSRVGRARESDLVSTGRAASRARRAALVCRAGRDHPAIPFPLDERVPNEQFTGIRRIDT